MLGKMVRCTARVTELFFVLVAPAANQKVQASGRATVDESTTSVSFAALSIGAS